MVKKEVDNIDCRLIDIGEKLKQLRIKKGYSSYEHFAYEIGMSRRGYWALEKGTNFTINTLLRILDVHKISLKDFFQLIDDNNIGEGQLNSSP